MYFNQHISCSISHVWPHLLWLLPEPLVLMSPLKLEWATGEDSVSSLSGGITMHLQLPLVEPKTGLDERPKELMVSKGAFRIGSHQLKVVSQNRSIRAIFEWFVENQREKFVPNRTNQSYLWVHALLIFGNWFGTICNHSWFGHWEFVVQAERKVPGGAKDWIWARKEKSSWRR